MLIARRVFVAAGLILAPATALATHPGINGKIAWTEVRDANTPRQHRVVIVDGQAASSPTVRDGASDQDSEPAWSPDGKLLAFARRDGLTGHSSIWVQNDGGTALRKVFDAGDLIPPSRLRNRSFTSLTWLDKTSVAFVADGSVWRVGAAPGVPVALGSFGTGALALGAPAKAQIRGMMPSRLAEEIRRSRPARRVRRQRCVPAAGRPLDQARGIRTAGPRPRPAGADPREAGGGVPQGPRGHRGARGAARGTRTPVAGT